MRIARILDAFWYKTHNFEVVEAFLIKFRRMIRRDTMTNQILWVNLIFVLIALHSVVQAVPVIIQQPGNDQEQECSLIFNIEEMQEGQPQVSSLSMPPLEQLMNNDGVNPLPPNICKLVFVGASTVIPEPDEKQAVLKVDKVADMDNDEEEDKYYDPTKPIYELQVVVWPMGTEQDHDGDEVSMHIPDIEEQEVVYPEEPVVAGQIPTGGRPQIPIYEDQLVIFPELEFEEDHAVGNNDDSWTPGTITETPSWEVEQPIQVIENYQLVHPNGTKEYKLVLSNGLVNYKKMYNKYVDGKIVTVQEGYDSVPFGGERGEFHTLYYIADENGYNIYKVEHDFRRPEFPAYLNYNHYTTTQAIEKKIETYNLK